MKYHKDIYFPEKNFSQLEIINNFLSRKKFTWSIHAKEQFSRVDNIQYFYDWFNMVDFKANNIIEYTVENEQIKKVLYRIKYNNQDDICLSISNTGNIITIWFNNKNDFHKSLDIKEYNYV